MGSVRDRSLRAALQIGRALGSSRVIDDPDALERFARDESEQEPRLPDAAILPRDAQEAALAIGIAASNDAPVTPRAGGTGKSGGAVPVLGGLVIACEGIARIKEVSQSDLVAVVEPGVVLARLHEEAEQQGLFYPPDPASLDSCCLGGNVAENAGGPRAFKYGVTGHYVLGLQMANAGGKLVRVGHRPVKGVAGYELAHMLVGSEGTLGFFTELTLRLVPKPPEVVAALALFASGSDAGAGIQAVLGAGLVPRVLEIMDRECLVTVRRAGVPIPQSAQAMVLAEFDGSATAVEADLERAGNALVGAGSTEVLVATGVVERDRLWKARRELSDALKRSWKYKIADDIAVPRGRLVEMIGMVERMALERGLVSATYGHAGDGNLHVNYLWTDPGLCDAAREARVNTLQAAIDMGGTITGEHGIGSVKRDFLARELDPEALELSRGLKRLLDPRGILNPGKILP